MQPPSLNLIRPAHFGLVRCDDGQAALHLHYTELDAPGIGMVYQDLGAYHQQPGCVVMEAQIDLGKRVITVKPCRPTNEYKPLKDVSSHLGCEGDLHFINPDSCKPIEGKSGWKH